MIFDCHYVIKMLEDIEKNAAVKGKMFWEKILYSIRLEHIQENSFSEFETFGTYMAVNYPTTYNTYPDILWHIVTLGIADNTSQQFLLAILFQAVYLT